jgi:DNA-binding NarL/FixJ family response regulator
MIKVIVVDEHALMREGVTRLLEQEQDMRLIAAFADGHAAVRFAAREEPDVAVLDVAMTGGIDVARRLRAVAPRTRQLVLSMQARPEVVQQALWAGVNGYLLKEAAGHEVVAAIRVVHGGQRYLGEGIPLGTLAGERDDPLERLSAREMEVLKLVVEGNTSMEVASQLGLSPKSIDTYRSRLMSKLDLDDLPALVKFAIRRGLTSA